MPIKASMSTKLLNTGILVILLIIIGKLIAFGKDIVISAYFGASTETDAYFIALNITTIIFIAFYSTVTIVFLPLYNENLEKKGVKKSLHFTSNAITLYVLITIAITALSFVFSNDIITIISNTSMEGNSIRNTLTTKLLRIMVFSFSFSIIVSFTTSIQLSNKLYLTPHLVPIINNLVIVLSLIILGSTYGIFVPAIAGVLAWVLQVPLHFWFVRNIYRYKLSLNPKDPSIKKMGVLFFPAFLGVFVDQLNIMVDTILASGLEDGSISALNYSSRLISFASGIFIMAIMSIAFPLFSKAIENNDDKTLNTSIQSSLRLLLLLMVFISSIVFVFYQEIVSIVYLRGKFDQVAVDKTASVFFYYGLGLIFLALRELFNKVFYAKKNTKIPLVISIIAVSVNIILSLLLVAKMGVNGLALASSISLLLYVVMQLYFLNKLIGSHFYNGIFLFLSKIVFAVLCSSLVMLLFKFNFHFDSTLFSFIFISIISLLVYYFLLSTLKINETKILNRFILSLVKA